MNLWIAVVVVVFIDGSVEQDYAVRTTESACKQVVEATERYIASKSAVIAGYKTECILYSDLKRPGTPS